MLWNPLSLQYEKVEECKTFPYCIKRSREIMFTPNSGKEEHCNAAKSPHQHLFHILYSWNFLQLGMMKSSHLWTHWPWFIKKSPFVLQQIVKQVQQLFGHRFISNSVHDYMFLDLENSATMYITTL